MRVRSHPILLATTIAMASALPINRAAAQRLPSEPFSLLGGRLVLGGEAAVTVGPKDSLRWYNYTDYEHDALRGVRLAIAAAMRATRRVSLLAELRSDNFDGVHPYALFVRVRPWLTRDIDIQAGIIPPSFGAFARRAYGTGNPLIGFPLAYQYLTTMRSDAVPRNADDLLRMRSRGWRVSYPIGSAAAKGGLPLVSGLRWDTGVQVRAGWPALELTGAVTTGTLANPRVADDNGGKQLAGRALVRPSAGVDIGVSAARGASLSHVVTDVLPPELAGGTYTQRAFGADVETSHGHWVLRGEAVFTSWQLPAVSAPRIDSRLGARAMSIEGRYMMRPGFYAAARADWLDFSGLQGSRTAGPQPWDAPVRRLEAGGGYYLRRNLVLKAVFQHNRRGGLRQPLNVPAVQLLYWF